MDWFISIAETTKAQGARQKIGRERPWKPARSELAGWNVLFPETACLIYWWNLRNVTSVCGFDLSDKDSKYLIVLVKLCTENSSRASGRKLRILLVTKSQAGQARPPADGHFLPGFLSRIWSLASSRRHRKAGECPSLVKTEKTCNYVHHRMWISDFWERYTLIPRKRWWTSPPAHLLSDTQDLKAIDRTTSLSKSRSMGKHVLRIQADRPPVCGKQVNRRGEPVSKLPRQNPKNCKTKQNKNISLVLGFCFV